MAKKVFLDAGHGSSTAGKRTPDGYREHWINVNVAYFLALALSRCGITVVKSAWNDRNSKDDVDVPIVDRQNNCRKAVCDVAVSIHANAYGNDWNDASGVITYIHNIVSKQRDSKRLAEAVQKHLIEGTKQKNRGIGMKSLGMCNAEYMKTAAAILVEVGFMTNREEAELMQNDNFCREQAEEICHGICDFLGVKYSTTAVTTSPSPAATTTPTTTATESSSKNTYEPAKSKDSSLAGKYTVTGVSSHLNIRRGAGTNKIILTTANNGDVVASYGYYTDLGSVRWLLVTVNGITGYASKAYLKKQ